MSRTIYYHYTTIAGCLGIITSRKVWLTDYRFLNDKQELKQGLSALLAHLAGEKRESFERAFLWHGMNTHHCVLSMSKSPKILSQWRAYAADGTGVAIGFDDRFLKFAKIDIVDCQYENHETYAQELATKYASFVDSVHQARLDNPAENSFMEWIDQHKENFSAIVKDIIALKNPAFVEEQEVRAVRSVNHGTVKMRLSNQLLIPYTEANFWEDDEAISSMAVAIPEIWLGPKCNELNRTALAAINIGMCMVERYDCGYV